MLDLKSVAVGMVLMLVIFIVVALLLAATTSRSWNLIEKDMFGPPHLPRRQKLKVIRGNMKGQQFD
jgi:hypothetical protein